METLQLHVMPGLQNLGLFSEMLAGNDLHHATPAVTRTLVSFWFHLRGIIIIYYH
jgi:hypothetical protein